MKLDEMKLDLWGRNTIAHYEELLTSNPRTTIGFTLAADIIYAARNGAIKRSEARGGDEWRTIALNLKRKYGESLSVDEVRSEMSPAKIAAAILGKSRTPKKTAAAQKNARLGGWPKGRPRNTGLTALQQQAYDLRQQGLKIKEIAARMGRQPENVRQLLARVASKLNIPGGWAGEEV